MNTKLLRRIQKQILAHPTQVEMGHWTTQYKRHKWPIRGCGTAACIAGWALHLKWGKRKLSDDYCRINAICPERPARQLLMLTLGETYRLFYQDQWPLQFQKRLDAARGPKTYAKAVAQRIDHFIATKGQE